MCRRRIALAREVAAAALAAIVILAPSPEWIPPEIVVVLRILVPFEAAVRSEMRARTLVALGVGAGACGWASMLARGAPRVFLDLSHQPLYVETLGRGSPWLTYAILGGAVAAAAVLARRARSMTAVPLDHTILADLGKTVPGTVDVTAARSGL